VDDGDAADEPDIPPRASGITLIIRWWREGGARDPGEARHALRGTIGDLSGRTLGSFAGLEALFRLLRKVMGNGAPPG